MYKTPAPPPTRRLDPSSRSATPCGAAGCPRVCWRPGRQTHSVHQVELPVWEEIKAIFFCSEGGAPFSHPMDIYFKRYPWYSSSRFWSKIAQIIHTLVGGWTNPFEKYYIVNLRIFLKFLGWTWKKWVATTQWWFRNPVNFTSWG